MACDFFKPVDRCAVHMAVAQIVKLH
jgi:hypothetical protein